VKHFLPAILWAIVIFILSTVGGLNAPDLLPDLLSPDKLAHTAAYFIQAVLLGWGSYKRGYSLQKALLISVLTSSVFGILLEIVQYLFFPNRYFEWWDMVANVTGAVFSSLFTFFLYRKK